MARFSRIVVPGLPHHVTQRGARRLPVFFARSDYGWYQITLAQKARQYGLEIWTYCLMPNHVHLVVVPNETDALAAAIGQTHQRYARDTNRRQGWTGHLWQERFASYPMGERHLFAAIRYVLLNPVRAGLVERPEDWPHSSARSHLLGSPDPLVKPNSLADRISNWSEFLSKPVSEDLALIRRHTRTGRPLGSEAFVRELERISGRRLRPRRRNRPTATRSTEH